LESVFEFLHHFMALHHAKEEIIHETDLVAEELFTNIVKHNRSSKEDIAIALESNGNALLMTVEDPQSVPFNITSAPQPDLDRPLQDREAGGLGIVLIKQLTDDVQYEYRNGRSIVTITKQLE
jgi:anti-sigma regulatory factor (Ser/Thr protein kinase)